MNCLPINMSNHYPYCINVSNIYVLLDILIRYVQRLDMKYCSKSQNTSIDIDFIDTLIKHVDPIDISLERVQYLPFYAHVLKIYPWQTHVLKYDKRF